MEGAETGLGERGWKKAERVWPVYEGSEREEKNKRGDEG